MKQGKPQGNVYFVVSFMPFGRQLPSAFPEVVLECRDPRVSIAIGRLPALMRKYGFGRYAVLAEFPSGPRRYVVSATFSDAEADQLVSSPHSCPQCQAVRRAQREEANSSSPAVNSIIDLGEIDQNDPDTRWSPIPLDEAENHRPVAPPEPAPPTKVSLEQALKGLVILRRVLRKTVH